MAALVAGCTGDQHPAATPMPTPAIVEGLPPLIVSSGRDIAQYVDGRRSALHRVAEGNVTVALSAPNADGIVFQHDLGVTSRIVHLVDGDADTIAEGSRLLESAFVDGAPSVVTATCDIEDERHGDVTIHDLASGRRRRLAESCAPEYGVGGVSFGDGVFVVSATSDLTEVFRFYRPDGTLIEDRPNPTDDLAYNDAPYLRDATLSPDGKLLAYLAGPDSPGLSPDKKVGDWVLIVVAQPSGEERLRYRFAGNDRYVNRLDFDGRWAIVSFAPGEVRFGQWSGIAAGELGPVAVIDTKADDPTLVDLGFDGVATIATER